MFLLKVPIMLQLSFIFLSYFSLQIFCHVPMTVNVISSNEQKCLRLYQRTTPSYVCMYGWMDVCMYVCMYVCMDGWMYGWMDGWMDGRMYEPMYVSGS